MKDFYSESIADTLLLAPVRNGADKLCILSAIATPSMSSWLFKTYEERNLGDIKVELIVTSTCNDGVDSNTHEGFKKLHGNRNMSSQPFVCCYLCEPPLPNSNLFIWLKNELPVEAFECAYDFTQKSILGTNGLSVSTVSPKKAFEYYKQFVSRSIFCNHAEVEESVLIRSADRIHENNCSVDDNTVTLSLLSRTGDVGMRSGLNWGQRNKRNRNEAYIPLPSKIAKKGFFPADKQHFLVVTDDHHVLQLRVEQQNDKAITTPECNALLGEYFRNRLNLPNGAFVSADDLKKYGRCDVSFIKIDDEQFYMDFSPQKLK